MTLPSAKEAGQWLARWIGGAKIVPRSDNGEPEERIETSVERLGYAVVSGMVEWIDGENAESVTKVGPFIIGNWYETAGGELVKIVGAYTKVKGCETVIDHKGMHRYARSNGRTDDGRLTGADWDDDRNIVLFRRCHGNEQLLDAAKRLVDNADFRVGGVLNAWSKARELPSQAMAHVKARNLATLRDAVIKAGQEVNPASTTEG